MLCSHIVLEGQPLCPAVAAALFIGVMDVTQPGEAVGTRCGRCGPAPRGSCRWTVQMGEVPSAVQPRGFGVTVLRRAWGRPGCELAQSLSFLRVWKLRYRKVCNKVPLLMNTP